MRNSEIPRFLFFFIHRFELCPGKRASRHAPDCVLLRRFLRADGMVAGADNAKGVRLQIPVWPGDEGGSNPGNCKITRTQV